LEREIFFLNQTVKPNTKLFKCIESQGIELDIKEQFDWYQRDMMKFEPLELLIQLGKYLDLFKGTINDQLITPNFKINLALEDDDEEEMYII